MSSVAASGCKLKVSLDILSTRAGSPFLDRKFGPQSFTWPPVALDVATWTCWETVFISALAASGTQTIDWTAITRYLYDTAVYSKALGILVMPTGSDVKVEPGASNPLTWFFGGTTPSITIPDGGMFLFALKNSSAGQTVDATHCTHKFTNTGATALDCYVHLIGKT